MWEKHCSLFVEAKKLNPHIMLIGMPLPYSTYSVILLQRLQMPLKIVLMGLISKNCLWIFISILIIHQNIRICWLNSVSFVIKSIIRSSCFTVFVGWDFRHVLKEYCLCSHHCKVTFFHRILK